MRMALDQLVPPIAPCVRRLASPHSRAVNNRLLVALLLPSLACAHAPNARHMPPPPPPNSLASEVAAARHEAQALLHTQAELAWSNWVYGDPLDLAHTYEGHEALFSKETIAKVKALEAEAHDPLQHRALEYLRVFLGGELVGRATAPLADRAATLQAEASFQGPDGNEHPFRELERLTAGEKDHRLRVALYDGSLSVVEKLNPLLIEREKLTATLLPQLGYPTVQAFSADLRMADLTALKRDADDLLSRTDSLYRAAMDRELRTELGLPLADARRADIPRFNRSPDLDAFFPADKMVARLETTLRGLGIDLEKQPNIRIDDKQLPSKNPRAVCFPVQVPSDVRLSLKPIGGVADYRALFHEAGHAEHYAHTTATQFEFQQLGDNSATEAYAFLLEGLIDDPLWLADNAGLTGRKLDDFVRASAVKKLYLLRRYAGKLLFELGADTGPAEYQAILTRAYGFPVSTGDSRRYLVDRDDFLYSADYFRAWFLAAQIEEKLKQRFGARWWTSAAAGDVLKSLWAAGNALSVEEVAQRLGDPGLKLEPLLRHFEGILH